MLTLRIVALYAVCIALASCGGVSFVGFVSNPGGNATITGTVTAVSNGFVSSPAGLSSVTVVTVTNSGIATTVYFCGDQKMLFPLNQTVRVEYTQGILCSLVIRVTVVTHSQNSGSPTPLKTES